MQNLASFHSYFYDDDYKRRMYRFIVNPIIMISSIALLYTLINVPSTNGLECVFLLPLSFLICIVTYKHTILFNRGGMALKVLYTVMFVRYVVMPVLSCYLNIVTIEHFTPASYRYAIFVEILEIFTCFITINKYYERKYDFIIKQKSYSFEQYEDLSIGGLLVILFSAFLIARRGLDNITRHMRFGLITDVLEEDYGYDIWMAQTLTAFIVIIVTSIFQKRQNSKPAIINFIIPLVVGMLSCMMAFGNNRMMIVYFALSAISILYCAFPRYKLGTLLFIIPAFALMLFSFTMTKQFGTDITTQKAEVADESILGSLNVYISSTEAIAKTYDLYSQPGRGDQICLMTPIADVLEKTVILQLPGLGKLRSEVLKKYRPSWRLAMTDCEICPVAGQAIFYGSPLLGWALDIVAFLLVIKLMIILEIRSKLEFNLGRRYIFTWLSIVCGMIMCYNLGIMYCQFTYIPFFTAVAIFINNKIRFKNNQIVNE